MFYQYRHLTSLQLQGLDTENQAQGMNVGQLLERNDIPHVQVSTVENILDENGLHTSLCKQLIRYLQTMERYSTKEQFSL